MVGIDPTTSIITFHISCLNAAINRQIIRVYHKKDSTICGLREACFKYKGTYRQSKWMEKVHYIDSD